MRIETMTAAMTVDVSLSDGTIELRIGQLPVGEPREAGSSVVRLSIPQAEMVLHALGFAIAQFEEQQRRAAEQRQRLAQVVADTEVRLR